jgi:alpha-tubulin suppressor-like RCC1 family protein
VGEHYYPVAADAVAIGDFTGDGRLDVAVATRGAYTTQSVALLVQTPTGALADPQRLTAHTGELAWVSAAAGDIDGDGDTDLLVGSSNGIDVFEQADGGLKPPRLIEGLQVYEVDLADINGDGKLDLVVDTAFTSGLRTMLGLGGGEFGPPVEVSTGDWPYAELEVGDVTGDGIPDLVGHHVSTLHVRAGNGDGTFAPAVAYPLPPYADGGLGLALGDFNGDGRTDVAMTNGRNNPASYVFVLNQTSAGTFGAAVQLPSLDLADPLEAADMNLDGRMDLVTAHTGWDYAGVYLQLPDGTFAPEQLEYTGRWYYNSSGALDVGDVDGDGLPDIAVGSNAGLVVLRSATREQGWGLNNGGQLGVGGTADAHAPGAAVALPPVATAAAGGYHNLAVTYDRSVWTWGLNNAGQLGDGTTVNRSTPVKVPGLTGVTAVAGGTVHSAAVRSDGTVWTWGWNHFGQLGTGDTAEIHATPTKVQGLTKVTAVATGLAHTLAVTSNGSVWAWGLGHVGQLGNGSTASSNVPVKISGLTDVVAVAAGNFHSMALTRDGRVWTWGLNDKGQLGTGSSALYDPTPKLTSLDGVRLIGAGAYHSVAVRYGSIYSWGLNSEGELGDDTRVNRSEPVWAGCCVESIAVGWYHAVGVTATGGVVAWGWNYFGQLGTGTTEDSLSPVDVPGLNAAVVGAGIAHTFALTARGG